MPNDNNEELEKTKVLDALDDLNNQILEFNNNPIDNQENINEENLEGEVPIKPEKTKLKDKIKHWWESRTKKQRIIIIISSIILVLIIIMVGVFFLVKSLNKSEETIKEPDVVVQEENYRYENGKLIFLNGKKEEIGTYTCENQNEELCYIAYYSQEDNFDIEKSVYEDNSSVLIRSAIVEESYAFVVDNPKKEDTTFKLYNIKEEKDEGSYNLVKKVTDTKLILKDTQNKYGVVEITNGEVTKKLDFKYDYLGYITNDKNTYVAKINSDNFLIDEVGNNLTKAITGTIKNFNEVYIKVLNGSGKYEVYNYNNQNTFNESFDYIELRSDYAILINEDKMNLKFYDKNKLNEEVINLNNKDYIKTNVYDKDNKLVETKESFSVEENNNIITISLLNGSDSNNITINKSEGILSKNLRNINYFNGKLYIYSDTDKKSLLGTYTCSNKNNVTSSTTALTNCSLASDKVFEDNDLEIPGTVGVIPVFNERFIFINDNPDLVNDNSKTIVLYDLKKNSSLGKYNEVNTYSYTGTNDITFSTVTDHQVIAKNQNGNFGVIKINLTEITGHIGFNYSEMEKLGDYYVAKDANGYLLLSKNNGVSVTSNIPYKVRNYKGNYVKAKKDNSYIIYDCTDKTCKEISTKGYKYIELYDNYYAGVNNNNELGVYPYGKDNNLISGDELIKLNLTNYYGNGTLAFKITGNTIQIGTEADNYITVPQNINISNEE